MKSLKRLAAVLLLPILFAGPVFADKRDREKEKKAPEKKEAAKKAAKPSLTYYYFDG